MLRNRIAALALSLVLALTLCLPGALADGLKLTLPASLTRIEAEAFMGDTSIGEVAIPDGVTYIGPRAFKDCGEVTVTIPPSVLSIADSAFSGDTQPVIVAKPDSYAYAWATGKGYTVWTYDDVIDSLQVTPDALTMGVGETQALSTLVVPEGAHPHIIWATSASAYVSVNDEGLVTAKKVGSARITATSVNGKSAQSKIDVLNAPTSITMTGQTKKMGVGEVQQLGYEYPAGSGGGATFSLAEASGSQYCDVTKDGVIAAKAIGSAKIKVTSYNGVSDTITMRFLKPPTWLSLNKTNATLEVGDTLKLTVSMDEDSGCGGTWTSSNAQVASVDNVGLVTALKKGTATITAKTYNGISATCKVTVTNDPTSIAFEQSNYALNLGDTLRLTPILSEGSESELTWAVEDGTIVSVDNTGLVTALARGTTRVKAITENDLYAITTVTVVNPYEPTSISFAQDSYTLNAGQTLKLTPILSEGSQSSITWEVEDGTIASVDGTGLVTGLMRGTTRVKATTDNSLYAITTVVVEDPYFPEAVSLKNTPPTDVLVGATWTPQLNVVPTNAIPAMEWRSSNSNVVFVDAQTGAITAVSLGTATIKGVSHRNTELSITYKVRVSEPDLTLVIPARRTTIAEIQSNMAKIEAVRDSAYGVLRKLYQQGTITQSDYNTRKAYIGEAFDMYLFPWITTEKELYWNASNSENGAKDFKPGVVYYGLPYTQNNRHNTDDSVLRNGYWTDSGKGYYVINNDAFSQRNYPGNDCSSFVSAAIWGYSSSRSTDTTYTIYSASYYVDISDWKQMRPGDLIVKQGHVLLFLYWADSAKTSFMLIEQGGDEPAINTVSANIRTVEYYQKKGYKVRRVKSLA